MRPDRRSFAIALVSAPFVSKAASSPVPKLPGSVLHAGPTQQFRTLRSAVAAARAGDTIEVDAGDYRGDVALIEKDFLRIVGTGGRARLIAAGADVEGKGIVVVRANGVEIENLEFIGARVADHYGCGIRLDKGSLLLRNCRFIDNEFGLMTANEPTIVLEILGCEFSGLVDAGGRGAALSHSLYAGIIDSLRVETSYFHHGSRGHLLKSRARTSIIRYNRLTDENGISSYELEFPDGGIAEVVGNVIQQGRRSETSTIVSFGAENLRWKENRLDLMFNTIVNDMTVPADFVSVHPKAIPVNVRHNVFVGTGELRLGAAVATSSNVRAKRSDFVNADAFDFRPRVGTSWVGAASGVTHDFPPRLLPQAQYKHPASQEEVSQSRFGALNPGAFQTLGP